MSAALLRTSSVVDQATTATTSVITVGAALPVGTLVVVMGERATTTASLVGLASCVDSKGNTYTMDANANRASTHDMVMYSSVITTALASGDTITMTWEQSSNRRVGVMRAFSGCGARIASSNLTEAANGNTNAGANGSSASAAATASPAGAGLVVGASALSSTFTGTGPDSDVVNVKTTAGTVERGICTQWREDANNTTQTSTITLSGSTGWAAMAVTYQVLSPPPAQPMEVVVAGAKKAVVGKHVVVGGVKKAVVGAWVVVGGVKKALS